MAFTFNVGNDVDTLYELALQQFKLEKAAMDLVAAGDGDAIYVNDGSDPFTNGQLGSGIPGNICNPNVWYLFNARDLSYQLCYRRSGFIGYLTEVFISANSNYDLSGAGPSTPPTADDEFEISGVSSPYIAGGGSSNNEPYTIHGIYGDADENYSWMVWHRIRGPRLTTLVEQRTAYGMFVDVPNPIPGDALDLRAVFCVPGTGIFGERIFDSTGRDEDQADVAAICFTGGRAVGQPFRQVGLATPVRGASSYAMADSEPDSDWTGRPWGWGAGTWWANPQMGGIGRSRMIGQSKLFRPVAAPTGAKAPYSGAWGFNTAQDRMYLGNVSIPWDPTAGNILI